MAVSKRSAIAVAAVAIAAGVGIGIFAGGGIPSGPTEVEQAKGLYLVGAASFRDGDLPAAELALLEAVRLDPRSGAAWHLLGDTRLAQGRFADAAAAYEEAVEVAPDKLASHVNLGRARKLQGNLEAARKAIARARELAPSDANVLEEAAELALEDGKLEEAERLYVDAASRTQGERRGVLEAKAAEVLRARGQLRAAADALRRAAIADPTASRWGEVGSALVAAGALDEAAEAYAKQAETDPDPAPWELVGEVRAAQGKETEALDAFGRANAKGDRVGAFVGIGRVHLRRGDRALAQQAASRAIAAFGESEPPTTTADLGSLLLELGQPEPAAKLLETVVGELDDPGVRDVHARALIELGRKGEAVATCSRPSPTAGDGGVSPAPGHGPVCARLLGVGER